MKTKNIIIAVATAAALTTLIFVACSKEKHQTASNIATKDVPTNVYDAMYRYWQLSDSAYRSNKTAFITCCNSGNYGLFYSMTGITSDMVTYITTTAYAMAPSLASSMGTSWIMTNECVPCSEGTLVQYGAMIGQLRDLLDTLAYYESPDSIPSFAAIMDSCALLCTIKNPNNLSMYRDCLFNCNMRKAISAAVYQVKEAKQNLEE